MSEDMSKRPEDLDIERLRLTSADREQMANARSATGVVSLRLPRRMLRALRDHADRRHTGYQVLLKRWIAERLQRESHAYLEAVYELALDDIKSIAAEVLASKDPEVLSDVVQRIHERAVYAVKRGRIHGG